MPAMPSVGLGLTHSPLPVTDATLRFVRKMKCLWPGDGTTMKQFRTKPDTNFPELL